MAQALEGQSFPFDHVGASVSDLGSAQKFYADTFGFSIVEDRFEIPLRGVKGVVLRNSVGARIELFHKAESEPFRVIDPIEAVQHQGWFQIAFRVPDLASAYSQVMDCGAREVKPPFRAPDGLAMVAFVADPDGNLIELIERR